MRLPPLSPLPKMMKVSRQFRRKRGQRYLLPFLVRPRGRAAHFLPFFMPPAGGPRGIRSKREIAEETDAFLPHRRSGRCPGCHQDHNRKDYSLFTRSGRFFMHQPAAGTEKMTTPGRGAPLTIRTGNRAGPPHQIGGAPSHRAQGRGAGRVIKAFFGGFLFREFYYQ